MCHFSYMSSWCLTDTKMSACILLNCGWYNGASGWMWGFGPLISSRWSGPHIEEGKLTSIHLLMDALKLKPRSLLKKMYTPSINHLFEFIRAANVKINPNIEGKNGLITVKENANRLTCKSLNSVNIQWGSAIFNIHLRSLLWFLQMHLQSEFLGNYMCERWG